MTEPRAKIEAKRGSWMQDALGRASVVGGRPSVMFGEADKLEAAGNQVVLPVGSRALVGTQQLKGTVRFVGSTNFASGVWIGVELDTPQGRNDGSVKGVRYFECTALHGIFVRPAAVVAEVADNGAQTTSSGDAKLNGSSSLSVLDSIGSFNEMDDESDYEEKPQTGSRRSSLLDIDEQDWASLGGKLAQHLRNGRRESQRPKRPSDSGSVEDIAGADLSEALGEAGGAEASKTRSADLAELVAAQKEGATSDLANSMGTPRTTPRRRTSVRPIETEEFASGGASAKPSRPPRTSQTLETPLGRQSRSRAVSPNAEAKTVSLVDLSAAGGPGEVESLSSSSGAKPRTTSRSTVDLTALRKQAREEKELRDKSSPTSSSPTELERHAQAPVPMSAGERAALSGERMEVQRLLAQAMEDHDVQQLRHLLPRATTLGVGVAELDCAQQILHFEVQRTLLHEIDDVRACVAVLSEAVHKAEERALAAERKSELSNERLSLSRGTNDKTKPTASRDEAWLAQVVDRLQKKVWEGLEWHVETIRNSVTTATSELLSAVDEIKKLRSAVPPKPSFQSSGLPAGLTLQATAQSTLKGTLQGTLLSTDARFDADCEERFAGRSSRESSGPPSQRATEDERTEELRILGEALGTEDNTTISPRSAKPPLAPAGPPTRIRSRSPAVAGPRHKAIVEKDAAVRLQKVVRGRQARKRVTCLWRAREEYVAKGLGATKEDLACASPEQGLVRDEIRQAAATVIQRGFRRTRSTEVCDLRHELPGPMHAVQHQGASRSSQFIKLVAQEGELRLGFKPSGLPPHRIFVEHVDPGSWSSVHGLWEGDELIEVGGQGVAGMTTQEFAVAVKRRPLHLTFVRESQTRSPSPADSRRPSSSNNTQATSRRPSSSNTCLTAAGDVDGTSEVPYLAASGHFGLTDSEPMANMHSDGQWSCWSSLRSDGASPRRESELRATLNMNLTLGSSGGLLIAESEQESPLRLNVQPPVDQSPRARSNPLGGGMRSPRHCVQRSRDKDSGLLALPLGIDREAAAAAAAGLLTPGADAGRRQRSPLEELVDAHRGSVPAAAVSPAGGRSPTTRSPMRSPRSPAEFLASLLQGSPHQLSPSSSSIAQSPQKAAAASPTSSSAQSPQKNKSIDLRDLRNADTVEVPQSPQKAVCFESGSRVELEALEPGQKLGFKPWGIPPDRMIVTEVELGQWADVRGVAPGDELVGCNGQDVAKMRPRDLLAAMKARPLQLAFVRGNGECQQPPQLPTQVPAPDIAAAANHSTPSSADSPAKELPKRARFRGRSRLLGQSPRDTPPISPMVSPRDGAILALSGQDAEVAPAADIAVQHAVSATLPAPDSPAAAATAEVPTMSTPQIGAQSANDRGLCQAEPLSPTPLLTDSSLRLSLTPRDDASSRSLSQLETSAAQHSASPSGIGFVEEKRCWSDSPSSPKFAIHSDLGSSMRSRVSLHFGSDCESPDWPHESPGNPLVVASPLRPGSPQLASPTQSAGSAQAVQPEPPSFELANSIPASDSGPPVYSFGPPRVVELAAARAARASPEPATAVVPVEPLEPADPLAQSLSNFLPLESGSKADAPSSPPQTDKLTSELRPGDAGSVLLSEMTTTTDRKSVV